MIYGQMSLFDEVKPALWKYDTELGIAFFCANCKRFVCSNLRCDCGARIDLDKVQKQEYKGNVTWDNYLRGRE